MKLNSLFHVTIPALHGEPEMTVSPYGFIFTYPWAIELTAKLIPKQCPDLSPKLFRDNCRDERGRKCHLRVLHWSLLSPNSNPITMFNSKSDSNGEPAGCTSEPLYTCTTLLRAKMVTSELWTILKQYHKFRKKEDRLDSSWKWKELPNFRVFICGNNVM